MSDAYSYEIVPRTADFGGGWRLRLLENGEEVGGGVFPPAADIEDAPRALQAAYNDAAAVAVATRKHPRFGAQSSGTKRPPPAISCGTRDAE